MNALPYRLILCLFGLVELGLAMRWIQAEPEIRKVLVLNGRTDENLWFDVPVNMYRWCHFVASGKWGGQKARTVKAHRGGRRGGGLGVRRRRLLLCR